ncbi:MAG: single-stranded DNA-binding protein [Bacteroidetes bacterium]|nr:single-stranded DNA-binding protein [Bacteroidota bacterium]
MATGVNKAILIGNLGRDPEVQNFENGVKKATFTLATTEAYKGKDGEKTTHTEWHNIVMWRGLADVAERFLKKGSTIYVEGRIRKREYEDKEGQKKFIYEILGDSMQMLGGGPRKEDSNGSLQTNEMTKVDGPTESTPEDDLPF